MCLAMFRTLKNGQLHTSLNVECVMSRFSHQKPNYNGYANMRYSFTVVMMHICHICMNEYGFLNLFIKPRSVLIP